MLTITEQTSYARARLYLFALLSTTLASAPDQCQQTMAGADSFVNFRHSSVALRFGLRAASLRAHHHMLSRKNTPHASGVPDPGEGCQRSKGWHHAGGWYGLGTKSQGTVTAQQNSSTASSADATGMEGPRNPAWADPELASSNLHTQDIVTKSDFLRMLSF